MRFISERNKWFYAEAKEGFPVIHVTGYVSQESEAQKLIPCFTRQSETLVPFSGLWQVCPHLYCDKVLVYLVFRALYALI